VLCKLRDNGIRFVAVDNANATELTVNILISVAQEEARLISERTKAALAASKARGTVLGGYRGGPVPDASLGGKARQEAADSFAALVGPMIREMRQSGLSLRQIAAKLTDDSIQTAAAGQWTATTVRNILLRAP
jgi:DNA invertase Pin-like site-specific DNA recombinase